MQIAAAPNMTAAEVVESWITDEQYDLAHSAGLNFSRLCAARWGYLVGQFTDWPEEGRS